MSKPMKPAKGWAVVNPKGRVDLPNGLYSNRDDAWSFTRWACMDAGGSYSKKDAIAKGWRVARVEIREVEQ